DPLDPRVLRFRTFSKAYGLAGARVGYVLGAPAIVGALDRVRSHFAVGPIPQAGALAALGASAHLDEVVRRVARARERIGAIARAAGLAPLPSVTNFVAVDTGRDGAFSRRLVDALLDR